MASFAGNQEQFGISAVSIPSSTPAWSKLWIGASLAVGEGILCGHAMEQLKILRQTSGLSYFTILKNTHRQGGMVMFLNS